MRKGRRRGRERGRGRGEGMGNGGRGNVLHEAEGIDAPVGMCCCVRVRGLVEPLVVDVQIVEISNQLYAISWIES